MVTIYGLEKCDTCGKARRWLDRAGVEHRFVDYKANPVPADTLKGWAKALGWDALINRSGTTWRKLPEPRRQAASDAEFVVLVRDHPVLVRRPVAVLPDGTVFTGFSDKLYRERFGKAHG
ncbi:MAG TPA: Spx/MgsR family RNA polymerase-binding regulatory protein [Xanthomonadales bacterium]|nr:Spx/MgsR family RNA polymerase-binding regulatory protein [Xanthomonadales bacterium]